jgi:hypothetical protein
MKLNALLVAPEQATSIGRRHGALLPMAIQTGLGASALIVLRAEVDL